MNVYPIININFKANYYKILKYGQMESVYVMTDNAEKLGLNPVCEDINGKSRMSYDGKFYIGKMPIQGFKYRILYEDTGKYENLGKKKVLDREKISSLLKAQNNQKNKVLMSGKAKGLLVREDNISEDILKSNLPLIIICKNGEEFYKYVDNVEGLIIESASKGVLSHFSALCRDYFSFGHLINDEKTLEDLSKLEGKFISISNENNVLDYKEISPIRKGNRIDKKIIVPQMRRVDKILTLDECEKDTVGNKAYNLKCMKNLVKEGKLEDVIIPKAFVLPYAYLERIERTIAENPVNRAARDNKILLEIKDFARNVITGDDIMIRSAFNGEDLEGYSAAGLYDSMLYWLNDLSLGEINCIAQSKNKPVAIKSRERHGIADNEIKPSVIIQDWVRSDYSFTAYTESPLDKNKVLIEMFINKERQCKPEPYQITYDRKTGTFEVEKEHSLLTEYVLDENYNLLSTSLLEKSRAEELFPILKKIVKNALVLEREIGKPQDIEGGIKAGQLYFWQTRNIVKKAIK